MAASFGVQIPSRGPFVDGAALKALGQAAEELSFDSVWLIDHIVIPRNVTVGVSIFSGWGLNLRPESSDAWAVSRIEFPGRLYAARSLGNCGTNYSLSSSDLDGEDACDSRRLVLRTPNSRSGCGLGGRGISKRWAWIHTQREAL